jgi:hypothetical protein
VRRLALLCSAVLLLGACGGNDDVDVRVDFRVTGDESSEAYDISCDPPAGNAADPAAVCEQLTADEELYFPEDGEECPLPVPVTYLVVTGTHGGDDVRQQMTPCSEAETRAVEAWMALLGFEEPPFEGP